MAPLSVSSPVSYLQDKDLSEPQAPQCFYFVVGVKIAFDDIPITNFDVTIWRQTSFLTEMYFQVMT